MKGLLPAFTYPTTTVRSANTSKDKLDKLSSHPHSEYKRLFLQRLRPINGKNKYKRFTGSPLRYAGGKTLAVGLIIEMIPDNIKRLISPFFGGGSVEIAVANEIHVPVKGFDIFDILINYWDVQIRNPISLYDRLAYFSPTREGFKKVKDRLKLHWKKTRPLDALDLAAFYFFNSNTSYGPHFLGWPSSVYLQDERYKKMIGKVRDFRAPRLEVQCESFETVIPRYKNDFLYCDPPYYLDGDSKTFVGMYPHRNFPIHHKGFRHEMLRDQLKAHKGGFILSYNDCTTIRQWYQGFNMIAPKWQYTFSQGDTRIGQNRLLNNNGSHIKQSHELLIWSLPK